METLGDAGENNMRLDRKPSHLGKEDDAMGRQQNKVEEEETIQA